MKREEIGILAQLLTGMKDAIDKLEEAKSTKNIADFNEAKKEILDFYRKINASL